MAKPKPKAKRKRASRSNRSEWMDKKYYKSLDALVDKIFEVAKAKKLTWEDMDRQGGLSETTVRKLGDRTTLFPQLRTVELLAYGIGGKLEYQSGQERAAVKKTWTIVSFNKQRKAA